MVDFHDLNLKPPYANWRIPFYLIIDRDEREGYVRPMDHLGPNLTYQIFIDDEYIGAMRLCYFGWWMEKIEYRVFKNDIVAYIVAWWGDVELKPQVCEQESPPRKPVEFYSI